MYWQLLSPTELAFSFFIFILMMKEWFALSPVKSHFLLWMPVLALLFQETMDTMMLPGVAVTQDIAFSLFHLTPGRSSTEVGGTMT